ncbi:hypothetical protein [Blastopirellula retiformator]|uniref:Uncharacterized protein n=1 Tax=Blastopirellula retiformator TaxID=2527970 RepID=A0A5C5VJV0_9BACT|nr:hypothetical protein [Blastopirellula retiformator]TWT38884.1 hypothetical protein Enr8_05780 [Blastopirellula retiformator]
MREILFQYESINPSTWAYVASLLAIGLYFKFNRVWSVRNLDIFLIILLAPGMLMVHFGQQKILESSQPVIAMVNPDAPPDGPGSELPVPPSAELSDSFDLEPDKEPELAEVVPLPEQPSDFDQQEEDRIKARELGRQLEKYGYIWLFCLSGLIVVRLFIDPTMVRRPMLEPNVTVGAMMFMSIALFTFLISNIIVGRPSDADVRGIRAAEIMLASGDSEEVEKSLRHFGPGYRLLSFLPRIPTSQFAQAEAPTDEEAKSQRIIVILTKLVAILSNLALLVGVVLIGYRHFENLSMGIGAAFLYLLLPYTALYTGRVDHVLPGALLVWAILCYRRPMWAGIFLGLAIGTVYYPLFLLPLWVSFYWQRGVVRFALGVAAMLVLLVLTLAIVAPNVTTFLNQFSAMFGLWSPRSEGFTGFWNYFIYSNDFRIPILVAFVICACGLAFWPAQKNLGTMLSCSAAIMLAAQFWHANDGTTYLAWYMPLLLLTVFRPNLEDRVALHVIGEGWLPRRMTVAKEEKKAA